MVHIRPRFTYSLGDPIPAMRDGARLEVTGCDGPVRGMLYSMLGLPGLERRWRCCASTLGNLRMAAATRVLCPVPSFDPAEARRCKKLARRVARRLASITSAQPVQDWEMEESLAEHATGARLRRYLQSHASLKQRQFEPADARVTGFVKVEVVATKAGKFFKPRMIQFRGTTRSDGCRYLVHVWKWLKPIEKHFLATPGLFCPGVHCAKTMDSLQRAAALQKCAAQLNRPVAVLIDGASFDAHVNREALCVEHELYVQLARAWGWSTAEIHGLRAALRLQLRNKVTATVRGSGRVSYTVIGNRMSGDLNTGLGNCVLMQIFVSRAMARLGIRQTEWRMLDDGDDCTIFVDAAAIERLGGSDAFGEKLRNAFLLFGQEITIDGIIPLERGQHDYDIERVEFCSASPVCVDGVWRLIRGPNAIDKCFVHPVWLRTESTARSYLAAIGVAEGSLNVGVPIWGAFTAFCRRFGTPSRGWLRTVRTYRLQRERLDWKPCDTIEPSYSTRLSFERAFGVSPAEQCRQEAYWAIRKPGVFSWH